MAGRLLSSWLQNSFSPLPVLFPPLGLSALAPVIFVAGEHFVARLPCAVFVWTSLVAVHQMPFATLVLLQNH